MPSSQILVRPDRNATVRDEIAFRFTVPQADGAAQSAAASSMILPWRGITAGWFVASEADA